MEEIASDDWCEIQFRRFENWIDVLSDRSIRSSSRRSLLFQFEIQKEWCWSDFLDLQFEVKRNEWDEFFEISIRNFKIYNVDAINCKKSTAWWKQWVLDDEKIKA